MTSETPDTTNTYIFDPESPAEMGRLINQGRQLTASMGGVFAGLPDTSQLHNILDVACGPGDWVLDAAFEHPEIEVAGIDISRTMIDHANARARTQHLTNASFGVMDITQPLDFADEAFDLLNARYLCAVLRREVWPAFIAECTRLVRRGGILRLTEPLDFGVSNSPIGTRLGNLFYQTLWRNGYGFSTDGSTIGITYVLPSLLREVGYQDIQLRAHVTEVSAGTDGWAEAYHNAQVAYHQSLPLFVKLGLITEEEKELLYQQVLAEMRAKDFYSAWHNVTVWGTRS